MKSRPSKTMRGQWFPLQRTLAAKLVAVALCFVLASCGNPSPPAGMWEGLYQADDVIILARLAIEADGTARVSAPNAFHDFASMSGAEREQFRAALKAQLDQSWPSVPPTKFEFDGKTFRKEGGVAPQLEWDSAAMEMTMIVYAGTHPTIRIKLAPAQF
jgi:hypothetical protein